MFCRNSHRAWITQRGRNQPVPRSWSVWTSENGERVREKRGDEERAYKHLFKYRQTPTPPPTS